MELAQIINMKEHIKPTLSEIKKVLYKEKPIAHKIFTGNIHFQYYADTSIGKVYFEVPIADMGRNSIW